MTGIVGWRRFAVIVATIVMVFVSTWIGKPIDEVARTTLIGVLGFYYGSTAIAKVAQSKYTDKSGGDA
jgi:hypothetical protein